MVPPENVHPDNPVPKVFRELEDINLKPEDREILLDIFLGLDDFNLGFDPNVLCILDDEEAKPEQLETLKEPLGETLTARLFSLTNSTYYGGLSSGKITRFIDVITHLGTESVKIMALFLSLLSLARNDQQRMIFARNFATSKLSENIAGQFDLKRTAKNTVTLGGLFVEIGRVIMLIHAENKGLTLDEEFIETHYPLVGAVLIDELALPHELREIVYHPYMTYVEKGTLSLSAIVELAHSFVEKSFRQHGRLVIQSPMPDPERVLYATTFGSMLSEQFDAVGLGQFLKILPAEMTEREKRYYEKHKTT